MHSKSSTPQPPVQLTCAYCGASFQRFASEARKMRGSRAYCSRACASTGQRRPVDSGVYAIIHRPTGRAYIGSSSDIRSRWDGHRSKLRTGTHENAVLQATWQTSGADTFAFVILERTDNLVPREQAWMEQYRVTGLFNLHPHAGTALGYQMPREAVERHAARMRGRTLTPETRAKIAAKAMGNRRGIANLAAQNHFRSLTDQQVATIRRALAGGRLGAEVAQEMGIPLHTIHRIGAGRTYPHVLPELIPLARANRPEWRRGERSGRARLTDADIPVIRARLARGDTHTAIARDYGVSITAISFIKRHRTWRHVPS